MSAKPAKKEGQGGGEQALVEARVYLTGALFKMDHHPMEVRAPPCSLFKGVYLLHPPQHIHIRTPVGRCRLSHGNPDREGLA